MENPWWRLPAAPPFVLPEDRVPVEAFNRRANERTAIHPELYPEPYLGDPTHADVFLLLTNPGNLPAGYPAVEARLMREDGGV